MEKQPPSEAAISSLGLVPISSSKRVRNEYRVLHNTPLSVLTVPDPSRKFPSQTTEAARCILTVNPMTASNADAGVLVPLVS
jgi:hypothetical protein